MIFSSPHCRRKIDGKRLRNWQFRMIYRNGGKPFRRWRLTANKSPTKQTLKDLSYACAVRCRNNCRIRHGRNEFITTNRAEISHRLNAIIDYGPKQSAPRIADYGNRLIV